MSKLGARYLRLVVVVGGLVLAPVMWAAHVNPHALNATSRNQRQKVSESQRTRRRMRHLARSRSAAAILRQLLTRTSASTATDGTVRALITSAFS
jgi:hypothetical protein